jgi:hypothetical protein
MDPVVKIKKGRGPGRPFPKGVSGNKIGPPKVPPTLREWCSLSYPEALKRITECLADPDGRVALKAAEIIVGRAVQAGVVQNLPEAPPTADERLRAAEEHLLRLGLAGETAALRAYLAANDARYSQREEQASTGSVDALNFGPALDSVDVSKASDEDLAAELARRQAKAST